MRTVPLAAACRPSPERSQRKPRSAPTKWPTVPCHLTRRYIRATTRVVPYNSTQQTDRGRYEAACADAHGEVSERFSPRPSGNSITTNQTEGNTRSDVRPLELCSFLRFGFAPISRPRSVPIEGRERDDWGEIRLVPSRPTWGRVDSPVTTGDSRSSRPSRPSVGRLASASARPDSSRRGTSQLLPRGQLA